MPHLTVRPDRTTLLGDPLKTAHNAQPVTTRARLGRSLAVIAVATLALLLAPLATFHALTQAHADAVTVTGANHAYDYTDGSLNSALPTATVSQTTNLVDQTIHVQWTGETPSTNDNTTPAAGIPATYNPGNTFYAVGVFECKGSDPTAFTDCFLSTAGQTAGNGGLGNAVDTITYTDGTGFADLHVENGVTNSDARTATRRTTARSWWCRRGAGCRPRTESRRASPPATITRRISRPTATRANRTTSPTPTTSARRDCSWANRMVVPLHFAADAVRLPRRDTEVHGRRLADARAGDGAVAGRLVSGTAHRWPSATTPPPASTRRASPSAPAAER